MIREIVIDALSEITGLDKQNINSISDLNLFENGILDSLSLVNLIVLINEKLNLNIELIKCDVQDLKTLNSIINLVEDYKK